MIVPFESLGAMYVLRPQGGKTLPDLLRLIFGNSAVAIRVHQGKEIRQTIKFLTSNCAISVGIEPLRCERKARLPQFSALLDQLLARVHLIH